MENHVHFVCVPGNDYALARTFNALHAKYSKHANRRKKVCGHLWQGRFYSTILDEAHVYAAVRYVENNPLRAGIVGRVEDYRWSSAREHIEGSRGNIVSGNCYLLEKIRDWRGYLQEKADGELIENIRKNSLTGRPCGDELFVRKLEKRCGRRLMALPRGRPSRNA
jgi:putative transposase